MLLIGMPKQEGLCILVHELSGSDGVQKRVSLSGRSQVGGQNNLMA